MRLAAASAALTFAAMLALAVITTQPAQAQTYTVLANFDGTNGSYSLAPMVQATNGNLYGTTNQVIDGSGYGTVFEITTGGTLTSLYSFCLGGPPSGGFCPDGDGPLAGLVQATNGYLYGTTQYGGPEPDPYGSVFKITTDGTLITSVNFGLFNGSCNCPGAGLVQATNGDLYGATSYGGVNTGGAVFKITPAGTLSTVYSFCANISSSECDPTSISAFDGNDPLAGLIQATDGDLYGTTVRGGINGGGTVFKISGDTLTVLYRFCSQINGDGGCTDGSNPSSVLVQAANGNLYGTTAEGGSGAACPDFFGCGTIFEITPAGTLTTLYSSCSQSGCADGANFSNLLGPQPALIQANDGNLYGTTPFGGTNGNGTIFEITPTGTLTTLYNFCSQSGCADGGEPVGGLVQDTNGTFYGTTSVGNSTVLGTVFSLSMGLGPFVVTRPTSGKVTAAVQILGTNLTGATSVTFNGTAATFTVVSSSEITTTVPAGATAGLVEVVTPTATLTSNVPFVVPSAPNTTALASSLNPSTFGAAVTFTATVTSEGGTPTGTVTFKNGSTTLGTGSLSSGEATFETSALSVGTHSITAVYEGSTDFAKSTSAALTQTVEQAASTTALASSLNPSTSGQSVTFTATVTSGGGTPTGWVTFMNGSSTLGTSKLSSGNATFKTSALSAGTHSITAVYKVSSDFAGSISNLVTQTVNP
jgi:uncharacterized repeat protein (TIGR03803 family)